jgi:hypothetical protein
VRHHHRGDSHQGPAIPSHRRNTHTQKTRRKNRGADTQPCPSTSTCCVRVSAWLGHASRPDAQRLQGAMAPRAAVQCSAPAADLRRDARVFLSLSFSPFPRPKPRSQGWRPGAGARVRASPLHARRGPRGPGARPGWRVPGWCVLCVPLFCLLHARPTDHPGPRSHTHTHTTTHTHTHAHTHTHTHTHTHSYNTQPSSCGKAYRCGSTP